MTTISMPIPASAQAPVNVSKRGSVSSITQGPFAGSIARNLETGKALSPYMQAQGMEFIEGIDFYERDLPLLVRLAKRQENSDNIVSYHLGLNPFVREHVKDRWRNNNQDREIKWAQLNGGHLFAQGLFSDMGFCRDISNWRMVSHEGPKYAEMVNERYLRVERRKWQAHLLAKRIDMSAKSNPFVESRQDSSEGSSPSTGSPQGSSSNDSPGRESSGSTRTISCTEPQGRAGGTPLDQFISAPEDLVSMFPGENPMTINLLYYLHTGGTGKMRTPASFVSMYDYGSDDLKIALSEAAMQPENHDDKFALELGKAEKALPDDTAQLLIIDAFVDSHHDHAYAEGLSTIRLKIKTKMH